MSPVTLPRRTALLGGLAVLSCTSPRKPVTSIHPRRRGYLLAIRGPLQVGGATLTTGEGATLERGEFTLEGEGAALWVDLAV